MPSHIYRGIDPPSYLETTPYPKVPDGPKGDLPVVPALLGLAIATPIISIIAEKVIRKIRGNVFEEDKNAKT